MLSVIGLQVRFSSVKDIDAFDYHLYGNKPIALKTDNTMSQLIETALIQINGVIEGYHLASYSFHLIVLDKPPQRHENESFYDLLVDRLPQRFASYSQCIDLNHALTHAALLSDAKKHPINQTHQDETLQATIIISANSEVLDGMATVLVCDQAKLINHMKIKRMMGGDGYQHVHAYATINTCTLANLKQVSASQHISQFLADQQLTTADIETVITDSNKIHEKRKDWLIAHESELTSLASSVNTNTRKPSTLMSSINLLNPLVEHFDSMLKLLSSILCLDQDYRLGTDIEIINRNTSESEQKRWQNSGYYYLANSTSYLSGKQMTQRNIMISHHQNDYQQLFLLSRAENHTQTVVNELNDIGVAQAKKSTCNGFLAQQPLKPIIFSACNIQSLIDTLSVQLQSIGLVALQSSPTSFKSYCEQQYRTFDSSTSNEYYSIVLLAVSFEQLAEQIRLAIIGLPKAIEQNMPWKTPIGSYFSGKLNKRKRDKAECKLPISFVYPGIGSLYVGMGKDLLRLFPECHSYINTISDDLSSSLQDDLINPRLQSKPSFEQSVELESVLRDELANIAEAGVSYACLLTDVFQKQLNLKASSAAGYSMGEVSMFAAQGCWEDPTVLSHRIRSSDIFRKQLSGPLMRLKTAWGLNDEMFNVASFESKDEPLWESYHLKAGVVQVEALLAQYPHVYITIINTYESLVIAGEPKQCKALAEQIGVRAIALNVHNIIHCALAKSEYENMKRMYSLAVTANRGCKLYSSSCYLPVPVSEKAIAVSIAKCLTDQVDFPRLIHALHGSGETVFVEMGAGKSLGTWIDRILKNSSEQVTCLSANQKNSDDYSAIIKTIAPLISLGYSINLQSFFNGSLIRPVQSSSEPVLVL